MKKAAVALAALVTAAVAAITLLAPPIAAGAMLRPARTARSLPTPRGCTARTFAGAGIDLAGWLCAATTPRRGTVLFLHGIADTRAGAAGLAQRYTGKGFDVVAYDGRAHGASGGETCTYGFREKDDLRRVLDAIPAGPVVVVGTSLGGAIALQAAAIDRRITGVVAAETFADLESIVADRTPAFVPWWFVRRVLREAEEQGGFRVADVSPVRAARSIGVPVLLIHGAGDVDTPPGHSQRIFEALQGPKRLLLVPGARHNQSLRDAATWEEIDAWVEVGSRG